MPGVLGAALSCVLAVVATKQNYGDGLVDIFSYVFHLGHVKLEMTSLF